MSPAAGFARTLRAEWTKFRTVRGWVLGTVVAALLVPLLAAVSAAGSHASCDRNGVETACPEPPLGPDGHAVRDKFFFVHRTLDGDGSITVRLTSMSGIITYPPPDHDEIVPGLVPWAKAGVIVKASMEPGSSYAAVMVTGEHGVRMQHDYTGDVAGRPGGAPRWLRLTRAGETLTGYESADGRQWAEVAVVRLPDLPAEVEIGMFAASPGDLTVKQADLGGLIEQMRFTETTAVFDQVKVEGAAPGAWRHTDVSPTPGTNPGEVHHPGSAVESGGTFTVVGNGDIAPVGTDGGMAVELTLTGVLFALVVVVVVAVLFVTAEYRRGLVRVTLAASPRRGRVLAAKALVIGGVVFAAGLAASAVAMPVGKHLLRGNGNHVLPVPALTEVRVIAGVAALLAVSAVLALALGTLFRRSAAAVVTALAMILLPHVLATASVLPVELSLWLLRVTPAAAFAVQQSIPEYPQVLDFYVPQGGYYPLPPWAGLGVLCCYAALALGLAVVRLNRRDA
ncbi:ABC transporter permease subunit [Nonomuraea sp. NPDC049486]|uniref:ABC transporter permease subunit n=1 Tax=Nonomuraea sp. NPDC049486 TaxID=3155773 RepID=UPI003423F41C